MSIRGRNVPCSVTLAVVLLMIPSPTAAGASAVLESALEAHGGLERWRSFGCVEYDLAAEQQVFGNRERRDEHHLVDLDRRTTLIRGDGYRLGYDGREAWVSDPSQLWRRPRFYHGLYFYLFGLPFVFADPGVNAEVLESRTLDGRPHDVVRITFDPGVGDSPGDEYVAWFDAATHRLRLALFTVTYYGPRGALVDGHHRAVEYLEWQQVDGLTVPRRIRLGVWSGGELVMSPAYSGEATFRNVAFRVGHPPATTFAMPEGGGVETPGKPPEAAPAGTR